MKISHLSGEELIGIESNKKEYSSIEDIIPVLKQDKDH
jgi:hypothetical protein